MTETHTRSAGPPTGGRLVAVIVGALVATVATMLLIAGSGLMWVDGKKDDDGYFSTKSKRFATSTYAVASDDLDIDNGVPGGDDFYGKVRLKVRSNDGAPVFVGIARTSDVDAYLSGSAHATLTDVEFSPFRPTYLTSSGNRLPEAPGTRNIWTASASGTGTQTLDWKVEGGKWSVVVMNADGSPGVDTGISAGANVPIVDDLAWGVSIAGFVLFLVGGGLIAGGLIRPRRRQSLPA